MFGVIHVLHLSLRFPLHGKGRGGKFVVDVWVLLVPIKHIQGRCFIGRSFRHLQYDWLFITSSSTRFVVHYAQVNSCTNSYKSEKLQHKIRPSSHKRMYKLFPRNCLSVNASMLRNNNSLIIINRE